MVEQWWSPFKMIETTHESAPKKFFFHFVGGGVRQKLKQKKGKHEII